MANIDTKAALIAELASAREKLSRHAVGLRRDLDVPSRIRSSFLRSAGTWLGGAAISGWLLARLPARKKKIVIDSGSNKPIKQAEKAGFLLLAIRFLFNIFRPAITSLLTRKVLAISDPKKR